MPDINWKLLEFDDWKAVEEARIQIHQAVQLVSCVPRGLLPNDPGDGYASLEWSTKHGMLLSQPFSNKRSQTGLKLSSLVYHFLKADIPIAEFDLKGKTMEQGLTWIKEQVQLIGEDPGLINSDLPYQIPTYPQASGEPFRLSNGLAFQEISAYYSNADLVLKQLQSRISGASDARCWPHHFDLAILITIKQHEDPEQAKTIGVGLSPGDENYSKPYFYITPWPYPEVSENDLPELPGGGEWHLKGWVGAILQSTELVKDQSANEQAERLNGFLETGIDHFEELLTDH